MNEYTRSLIIDLAKLALRQYELSDVRYRAGEMSAVEFSIMLDEMIRPTGILDTEWKPEWYITFREKTARECYYAHRLRLLESNA